VGAASAAGASAHSAGGPPGSDATSAAGSAPSSATVGTAAAHPATTAGSGASDPAGVEPALILGAGLAAADYEAIRAFLDAPEAIRVARGSPAPNVEVISAFTGPSGRVCRRVQETVNMGGENVLAWGDVCRDAQGGWTLTPLPHPER